MSITSYILSIAGILISLMAVYTVSYVWHRHQDWWRKS